MKKVLVVGCLSAFALLGSAREADACSWCSTSRPRCEAANYSWCNANAKLLICDQGYANCAWVYNADEVSADGSLATLASTDSPTVESEGKDEVRGCHGLILERDPSAERVAAVRSETRRIVL